MIDKFIYKFCDVMDRYSDWVNQLLFAPRCKCKKRKKK